jgi:AmpE protein
MILLILLICYALQRYWQLDNAKLSPLFDSYVEKAQLFFTKLGIQNPLALVIAIFVPVMLAVWFLMNLFSGKWFGLLSFLFEVVILFFCLKLYDPKVPLAHYFDASRNGEVQAAYRYGSEFLGEKREGDLVTVSRAITRRIFLDADRRVFSVLFWYILLGPIGAVIYTVACALGTNKHLQSAAIMQAAQKIHAVLDWLPMRIVGLTYALVGHVGYGFAYWRKHLADDLMASNEFAYGVGLAALERDTDYAVSADSVENEKALAMVKRTLLLWIVVIAVFTLISWVA